MKISSHFNGGQTVCIAAADQEELLKDDWTRVRPEKVAIPQGEETYILCGTAGRKEKERAIRHRFSAHMEDALQRLGKTSATGRLKDRNKMQTGTVEELWSEYMQLTEPRPPSAG